MTQGNFVVGSQVSLTGTEIFVHPEAVLEIGDRVHLEHCKIYVRYPGAILKIRNCCAFSNGTRIFADTKIVIGNYFLAGANCLITDSQVHNLDYLERRKAILSRWEPVCEPKPRTEYLYIGDDVFIGQGAMILVGKNGGVCVGDRSVIAAGSIIKESAPACLAGNPAKIQKLLTFDN